MNRNDRLQLLRNEMSRHNIGIYIVPTCDFHGSEYIGDYFKTREYLSGFTGSAGTLVVTMEEAALWTDGRYFLQAEEQLKGSEIRLMKMGEAGVPTIKEYVKQNAMPENIVGFDGRCITFKEGQEISEIPGVEINSQMDLVGKLWKERPAISCNPIWPLELRYAGMDTTDKIKKIRKEMEAHTTDILVLTALDEIAWVLNLRGSDIACTPVFLSYLMVTQKETVLFVQKEALTASVALGLEQNQIAVKDYDAIYTYLEEIRQKQVWIDAERANYNIVQSLNEHNALEGAPTPVLLMKAVKNDVEISNMKKAHLLDGIAMTKFIYQLKRNVGRETMTEISVGEQLEDFRKQADSYIEPSFEPIVGYQEHGAIVHYSATKETDTEIRPEGIVLIDSGGHYMEGTTDITRTISLGNVSEKMREMYTAVLRGHLNLAGAVLKEGCSGVSLDYLARKPLWEKGLDYNHGTGHGVGYLLNVHEAPNAFRYRIMEQAYQNAEILPGMITSDEPGIYLENEFGIRIENLIVCVEKEKTDYGRFYTFEPLTLVPYDRELIRMEELTPDEKNMLSDYHQMVYQKIGEYLTAEEKTWYQENFLTE